MKATAQSCMRTLVLSLIAALAQPGTSYCQRLSRDLNVDILVNQAGYLPEASKVCVVPGRRTGKFDVISLETQRVVYSGSFTPASADLGVYSIGDFSTVTNEGRYFLRADTLRSFPFTIGREVYRGPIGLIVHYFSLQRCGPSTTGYLAPCHVDDGVRIDNGKHQDVSGGWHDASDLRKWVGATIYGMIGLGKTYELLPSDARSERERILDELRWGNRYFLNMQEPQGYVMSFVGGDVKKHSDSNRWTDNQTGEEGGELKMIQPNAGASRHDMLVFGSKDDRVIETSPLSVMEQFVFVSAEAMMARIAKPTDPRYAQKCLEAAERCFDWCRKRYTKADAVTAGASLQASLELYHTTGKNIYRDFAVEQASILGALQAKAEGESPGGFFYTSASNREPQKDIWHGCMHLIALCDLIRTFPSHERAASWRETVQNYARKYLLAMSRRNSFGIVPYGLYTGEDPGGARKVGRYWYRYFMQPELDWWVGINSNLASAGVGLLKASAVLHDSELRGAAQRQLDWIIGSNPFNSSTIEGLGYNHPKHFPGSTFIPRTPVLPGAVLNGLGGDHDDRTAIGNGNWQISEYWTPMASYTIWLLAELSNAGHRAK